MKHYTRDKMSENDLNRLFIIKSGDLQAYKYRDDLKLMSNLSRVDIYQNSLDLMIGQLETLRVYISERFGPYTDYDMINDDISEGMEQLEAEDDDSINLLS